MNDSDRWSCATFRLFSRSLPPEVMGAMLGLLPDRINRIGDPVSRHGATTSARKEHAYFLESQLPTDRPLEDHLQALLERLEPAGEALRALGEHGEADISCGFSSRSGQGGFALSPTILHRLAQLGLVLSVDLYPPSAAAPEERR